MGLIFAVIILIISLAVLIFAGDKFVDSSVAISRKFKMPTAVIGATFVSLGTTLPEILVTIFSIKEQSGGIAVGNAVGSMIFNTALIGGILLVFSKGMKKYKSIMPIILICSILLLFVISLNEIVSLWEAILLLIVFVVFIIFNYLELKKSPESIADQNNDVKISLKKEISIFILSTASIAVSAYFMVEEAKVIGTALKISDTVIGLIVVAIGTSLPELITTITAIRKKQLGLGVGNIVGSNIINGTLLVGLTGVFVSGLTISRETLFIAIPLTLLCCILLFFGLCVKNKKTIGIPLLCTYILYYVYLILNAFNIGVI